MKASEVQLLLPWYGGRRREAKGVVVDAGPGGIGVRLTHALAGATQVSIDGRVYLDSGLFHITGQTEVASCRALGPDQFRVGLRFVDVTWQLLPQRPDADVAAQDAPAADTSP